MQVRCGVGYRSILNGLFCQIANKMHKPIAAINLGRTRADSELTLKIQADCADTLTALVEGLDFRSLLRRRRLSTPMLKSSRLIGYRFVPTAYIRLLCRGQVVVWRLKLL